MPRPSSVRDTIRALILGSGRHDWSIDDVCATLERCGMPADYSSVYRGLSHLERDGLVERVELSDGKTRYEARGPHHEHIRCTRCGAVAAVPLCIAEGAHAEIEATTGYTVQGHQVLFTGVCGRCSGEPAWS